MRADTKTVTIQAPRDEVVAFLADARNLPRWAVGFAKAVRADGDRWVVTTGGGEVGLRIVCEPRLGVVDFLISPAPGVEGVAASRVIPAGDTVEVTFTQFQAPGMPDDAFAASVRAVEHELTVLRALLEVECPL